MSRTRIGFLVTAFALSFLAAPAPAGNTHNGTGPDAGHTYDYWGPGATSVKVNVGPCLPDKQGFRSFQYVAEVHIQGQRYKASGTVQVPCSPPGMFVPANIYEFDVPCDSPHPVPGSGTGFIPSTNKVNLLIKLSTGTIVTNNGSIYPSDQVEIIPVSLLGDPIDGIFFSNLGKKE